MTISAYRTAVWIVLFVAVAADIDHRVLPKVGHYLCRAIFCHHDLRLVSAPII